MAKANKKQKCLDCDGTGIDPVKSNPFLKKDCETCVGTGSAHAPEYCYVCDICKKSFSREISDNINCERACHECGIIACYDCQTKKGDKVLCPQCDGDLYPSVL